MPRNNLQNSIEHRFFFDQLTAGLKFSQQLAISQSHSTTVYFDPPSNSIIFRNIPSDLGNYPLTLPENLQLMTNYNFRYLPNGRISRFRTITFYDLQDEKQIKLVLQLGNGQFEIQY